MVSCRRRLHHRAYGDPIQVMPASVAGLHRVQPTIRGNACSGERMTGPPYTSARRKVYLVMFSIS